MNSVSNLNNTRRFVRTQTLIARNTGFTLIELLVVIAIISILSAILFPVFATAREKSRQSVCLSNMKQQGVAFLQYSQDYDETLPCSVAMGNGCSGVGWAGNISPYVKNAGVFACPDDDSDLPVKPLPKNFSRLSYVYNDNLTNAYYGSIGIFGQTNQITSPSLTVLLWEMQGLAFQPNAADGIDGPLPDGTGNGHLGSPVGSGWFIPQFFMRSLAGSCTQSVPVAACYATFPTGPSFGERHDGGAGANSAVYVHFTKTARHSKGLNFLAADGHVKWTQPDNVSTGIQPESSRMAQGDACWGALAPDARRERIACACRAGNKQR